MTPVPTELVLMIEKLDEAPISAKQMANWTQRDVVLSRVLQFIMLGWPKEADDYLKPYWNRRLELSAHAGCILWGTRVVVPLQGRNMGLTELHGGYPGITRMKAVAHQLVWWPNLDCAIEHLVKNCEQCQQS